MSSPLKSVPLGAVVLTLMFFSTSSPIGADIIHADDVIIDPGSLCIGVDCANGENFGADTLRLKENNLRIHVDDTSNSASFPFNDWRLVFNDDFNGGANKFTIQDSTAGRTPFTIEAGARNNALYVDSAGEVGIGTMTPTEDLHAVRGDTPTLRLQQDGSNGFTPHTWDVAGNEAGFFVRNVTFAGGLPFRILPNSTDETLIVGNAGRVGINTTSPSAELDVIGDATISGNVSLGSSRAFKDDVGPVDAVSLLNVLADLPIHTWRYKTESGDVRHIGPMAEDFHSAFGFSDDPSHISIVDANGIALAAVKELHLQLQAKDREISALLQRLEALEDKLEP